MQGLNITKKLEKGAYVNWRFKKFYYRIGAIGTQLVANHCACSLYFNYFKQVFLYFIAFRDKQPFL